MRISLAFLAKSCIASSFMEQSLPEREVTVHFIRHAESGWNIFQAENSMWQQLVAQFDSKLKDAKLTPTGVIQSIGLASFINHADCTKPVTQDAVRDTCRTAATANLEPDFAVIDGDRDDNPSIAIDEGRLWATCNCTEAEFLRGTYPAVIATSTLSRAILTGVIALQHRIQHSSSSKVEALSILQELGSGIDAKTNVDYGRLPNLDIGKYTYRQLTLGSRFFRENENYFSHLAENFDFSGSIGDLNTRKSAMKPEMRFKYFCLWAMSRPTSDIIVAGHSGWLLKFLRSRLPLVGRNEVENTVTRHKLGNASLLTFKIVPDSQLGCRIVAGKSEFVFGTIHYAH